MKTTMTVRDVSYGGGAVMTVETDRLGKTTVSVVNSDSQGNNHPHSISLDIRDVPALAVLLQSHSAQWREGTEEGQG